MRRVLLGAHPDHLGEFFDEGGGGSVALGADGAGEGAAAAVEGDLDDGFGVIAGGAEGGGGRDLALGVGLEEASLAGEGVEGVEFLGPEAAGDGGEAHEASGGAELGAEEAVGLEDEAGVAVPEGVGDGVVGVDAGSAGDGVVGGAGAEEGDGEGEVAGALGRGGGGGGAAGEGEDGDEEEGGAANGSRVTAILGPHGYQSRVAQLVPRTG